MANLYRHYDDRGRLLYIGISIGGPQRQRAHSSRAAWWRRVRKIMIEPHDTIAAARVAEMMAIAAEGPEFNRAGRQPYTLGWWNWAAREPGVLPEDDPRWRPVAISIWCGHIAAAWLDGTRSLADRCQAVRDIMGARIARFSLYRRYGSPDKPK